MRGVTPTPPARRPGRPPSEKNKDKMNVTLRLRRPFYTNLKEFAREQGLPPGEVVMVAVVKYISDQNGTRQVLTHAAVGGR
jgi:hypothetical protein